MAQEFAPGIRDKKNYGEPTKGLTQDQDADYVLQHHQTMRNPDNPHYDLRLGSPETGMFSWAVPGAKLPEEGKRNLAVQTHVHEHGYNQFTGKIGKGYGAGIVTRADLGKAKITKISPNSIHFTVNTSKSPTNYSLVRIGTGKDARDWLLIRKKPKPEEDASVTVKAGQVSLLPWIPPLAAVLSGEVAHHRANRVADKAMASTHPSLLPPAPPLGITGILTIKQLRAYTNKYIDDPYVRDRVMESGERMLKHKNNAAFMVPEGKAKIKPGAVISSPGMPRDTFKHENGHAIDYMSQLIRKGKVNMGGQVSSALLAPFVGAKHTPLYKTEERAWDYSGVPKGDPVRESMLGTYEAGLKGPEWLGRYGIPGSIATNYAVKNPDKMHRIMAILKGLIKRGAEHVAPPSGKPDQPHPSTVIAPVNTAAVPGTTSQVDNTGARITAPAPASIPPAKSTNQNVAEQDVPVAKVDKMQVPKDSRLGKWSSVRIEGGRVKIAVNEPFQYQTPRNASLYPDTSNVTPPTPAPQFKLGPVSGPDPQTAFKTYGTNLINQIPVVGSTNKFLNRKSLTPKITSKSVGLEYSGTF